MEVCLKDFPYGCIFYSHPFPSIGNVGSLLSYFQAICLKRLTIENMHLLLTHHFNRPNWKTFKLYEVLIFFESKCFYYNFYIEVEEINVSALWLLTQSIYLYYFWFQVCKEDNRFHLFDKEKSENGINSNNVWKVTMKVRKATYRN